MKETHDLRRRPGNGNDTDITNILSKKIKYLHTAATALSGAHK